MDDFSIYNDTETHLDKIWKCFSSKKIKNKNNKWSSQKKHLGYVVSKGGSTSVHAGI